MRETTVEGAQNQEFQGPGALVATPLSEGARNPPPTDSGATVQASSGSPSTPKRPRRRSWIYVVVAFAIVIVAIVAAWALTGGFQPKSSATKTVLDPAGTYFTIPGGQFNGITFISNKTATLNGTFTNTYGIDLYTMTPPQYQHFVRDLNISGYEWTSGVIPNGKIYNLDLVVQPGAWVLTFVNPSPVNTTLVGFYSDLTISE